MNKKLLDYADEKGCLVQKYSNGQYNAIDSSFLTTNYLYQSYICDPGSDAGLKKAHTFLSSENELTRYWKNEGFNVESRRWIDPDTCSRDNSMGVLCCLVEMNHYGNVRLIASDILGRYSFFQNIITVKGKDKRFSDFCIAEWAVIFRGVMPKKISWLLYPLYYLFDLLTLVSVLVYVLHNLYDNNYNSPLFHLISQVECINRNRSTIFGKVARFMLYNFTPMNKDYDDFEPVVSQLKEYSRSEYDPPIYEVTARLLKKYRN